MMHGYFGTCASGLKMHAFPQAQPCERALGAACLDAAERDWARHGRAARALAEAHFDAVKVAAAVLERALP